jgi:hypothetical protein
MERSDERLSTRDLASGAEEREAGGERDVPPTDPADGSQSPVEPVDGPGGEADTGAAPRDAGDRDLAGERPADATDSTGAVATEQRTEREPVGESSAAAPEAIAPANPPSPDSAGSAEATAASERDEPAPLLQDSGEFHARWEQIQVRFVDEPRGAVEDADALVATVMKSLAEGFAQEREHLEAQWGRGEDISTEDLRVALQRYRSFFQRLLST